MAADLSKLVGYEAPAQPVSWNQRDLLLYATGIGAKADDLNLVYELDKSFAAIPTYPVVLALKGDSQELNVFAEKLGRTVPGMPRLDINKMVHGSQSIEILKTSRFLAGRAGRGRPKSGIILTAENRLLDSKKVPYARLYSSTFYVGAKATGGKFAKVIAGPPQGKPGPVLQGRTGPGDYNPLHIDPTIGKAAGFGGVILHGLSTFGFGARALIKAVGGGDPRSLKFFGVRFTSPVKPGDALETEAWEVGPGPEGTVEVAFITKNLTSGK
ncbi:peroxisomal dehydratase [Mycena olivaceomarginata]|nr:peroxisomal dehydratase [Mycena olivaceomarginata]